MTLFRHYMDHVQGTIAPRRRKRRSRALTVSLFLCVGALLYFGSRM